MKLRERDIIHVRHGHLARFKLGESAEDDPVRFRLDPDDIEPFAHRDAEAPSLAYREERNATMFSYNRAVGEGQFPGSERFGRVLPQKGPVIIVRHEADLLALRPERARSSSGPVSCGRENSSGPCPHHFPFSKDTGRTGRSFRSARSARW